MRPQRSGRDAYADCEPWPYLLVGNVVAYEILLSATEAPASITSLTIAETNAWGDLRYRGAAAILRNEAPAD